MTKFVKAEFQKDGDSVYYAGKFIARFKHVRSNKAGFIKFLVANFTVEEYFAARDLNWAPVTILESKGYVPSHIAKWLKNGTLKEWNPTRVDITKPNGTPVQRVA